MNEVFNRGETKGRRQALRNNMPPAEVILWRRLRGSQVLDQRFRRQHGVGPYVVDFYCPKLKLAIELDGDSHFREGAAERDRVREDYLAGLGIRVVRFLNTDVYDHLTEVLEAICGELRAREAGLRDEKNR